MTIPKEEIALAAKESSLANAGLSTEYGFRKGVTWASERYEIEIQRLLQIILEKNETIEALQYGEDL